MAEMTIHLCGISLHVYLFSSLLPLTEINLILIMYFAYIIFFTQFINCLLTIEAYKKNVTCVSAQEKIQGQEAVYIMMEGIRIMNNSEKRISHETYMPDNITFYFNCTNAHDCIPITFSSITELIDPNLILKSCFTQNHTRCETIIFNNLSKIDKLVFLSKTIKDKYFYFVNCSVNLNSTQICYEKDDAKLVYKSNKARASVYDEFICEEGKATSDAHDHRGTPLRRNFNMYHNPCDDDSPPPDVDCTKDVCISWQGEIVDCEQTGDIPPPESSQDTAFIRHPPKPKVEIEHDEDEYVEQMENANENLENNDVHKNDEAAANSHHTMKNPRPSRVLLKLKGLLILKKPSGDIHMSDFKQKTSHEIQDGRCAVLANCKLVVKHRLKYLGDGSMDHEPIPLSKKPVDENVQAKDPSEDTLDELPNQPPPIPISAEKEAQQPDDNEPVEDKSAEKPEVEDNSAEKPDNEEK